MIVQCPKCLKRYRLGEAKASLVRVHCRACGHGFLVSLSKLPSHELGGAGRGLKALVADIQTELRNMVVEILKRAEFHLFIAEDGESALELMEKESPRLLLTSPYLPKLMGVDLVAKVREGGRPQPIVFLLGAIHSTRRYRRRPESLYGADDYLEEGVAEETIVQKLAYHMDVALDIAPDQPPSDPVALRLARMVFTDLMVYNPDRMEKVASVEDFFRVFKEEAAEGKRYIEESKPGEGNLLRGVVADYLRRQASARARPGRK